MGPFVCSKCGEESFVGEIMYKNKRRQFLCQACVEDREDQLIEKLAEEELEELIKTALRDVLDEYLGELLKTLKRRADHRENRK